MDALLVEAFNSTQQQEPKGLQIKANDPPKLCGQRAEPRSGDTAVIAKAAVGRKPPTVSPRCPERRQTNDSLLGRGANLHVGLPRCCVLQRPRVEDVDLLALSASHEDVLPQHRHALLHSMVADRQKELSVLFMVPPRPNTHVHQRAHEHLLAQLNLESLWNGLYKLNLVFQLSDLKEALKFQNASDSAEEIHRKISVHEELAEVSLLPNLLGPDQPHGVDH
mmetsp:Transcript_50796/g.114031  ORF Transcript_50796/g.114031 Transcript_50796/m.114031 type:complete len:222 (+) Transcript_50796:192-857(+)